MIKLHLEIQFIRILYNENPKKNHYTNFTLQNEEGEELFYEQKFITSKSDIVELDKLTPFRFYMIVSNHKMTFCPFQINFVTKTQPSISRKIPIHQGHILKHFLNHQIFSEVKPLEQIYTFEEGEIIYTVTVLSSEIIADQQEFTKLDIQFKQSTSMLSNESFKNERSNMESRNFQEKDTGITSNFINRDQNIDYLAAPDIDLKSKKSMSLMSIEEIAEQIALQTMKQQSSMDESMIKSDKWCFKTKSTSASRIVDEKELQNRSQNKLKFVALLIAIGIALMLFDFINDASFSQRGGPKKRKQIERKTKTKEIKA